MRNEWINRCLSSLRNSTIKTIPVVVDNCSTDGTREFVPQQFPEAIWLPQDKNYGFGQANNIGIRYALENNADYVLLLNQDASLHKDAIKLMLEASDGISLISPLQLNGNGTKLDYLFSYILQKRSTEMLNDLLLHNEKKETYHSIHFAAACWFIPISIIQKIGGFNPLFFHYFEDDNYHHRLIFHGIKTMLVTKAVMYHDRNEHGNKNMFEKKRIRRSLLLEACNINNNFIGCVKRWNKLILHCYLYELPKGKYVPGNVLFQMICILFNVKQILNSRTKEKKTGLIWL